MYRQKMTYPYVNCERLCKFTKPLLYSYKRTHYNKGNLRMTYQVNLLEQYILVNVYIKYCSSLSTETLKVRFHMM